MIYLKKQETKLQNLLTRQSVLKYGWHGMPIVIIFFLQAFASQWCKLIETRFAALDIHIIMNSCVYDFLKILTLRKLNPVILEFYDIFVNTGIVCSDATH